MRDLLFGPWLSYPNPCSRVALSVSDFLGRDVLKVSSRNNFPTSQSRDSTSRSRRQTSRFRDSTSRSRPLCLVRVYFPISRNRPLPSISFLPLVRFRHFVSRRERFWVIDMTYQMAPYFPVVNVSDSVSEPQAVVSVLSRVLELSVSVSSPAEGWTSRFVLRGWDFGLGLALGLKGLGNIPALKAIMPFICFYRPTPG